jgi:hypothetical protein
VFTCALVGFINNCVPTIAGSGFGLKLSKFVFSNNNPCDCGVEQALVENYICINNIHKEYFIAIYFFCKNNYI